MDTEVLTGDAVTRKLWASKTIREASKLIYFKKFMPGGVLDLGKMKRGSDHALSVEDEQAPIIVRADFLKEKGDEINYQLIMKLTGAGVSGDSPLWDNEEKLIFYNDKVRIDQVRNGVRPKGEMTNQRVAFNMRSSAKSALAVWLAERLDQDIFTELDSSPTKTFYGGDATSTATIEATDYMTLALISKVKTYAKKAVPLIEPIRFDGKDYYLMIISPDQEYDLRVNDSSWAQAQREANVRGKDNPIFAGGAGIWDDVIIHSHPDIAVAVNWGSGANIAGASAIFMGKNALTLAWGKHPFWREQEFDYGNKHGFSIGAIYGKKKNIFNGADLAVVSVKTSRTNIT